MVRFQLCFLMSLSSSPFAVFIKTVALAMSAAELSHTRDGCILTTGKRMLHSNNRKMNAAWFGLYH